MTMPMLMPTPGPDLALAAALFRTLHDDSIDGDGVTRDAYGPGEQRAHDLVAQAGRTLGLEQHIDHAGNLALTLPGRDRAARRLVVGSHLDSVAGGGDYDGTVGVLAGLACLAGMRHADLVPACDITLLVTRAEEAGSWFPVSFPGSRAALGMLEADALSVCRRDTGRTLEAHLRACGFDPDRIRAGDAWLGPRNVAAFLEMHIEQGPVLEAERIPVGIVTGIPGSRRHRQGRIAGETNHSGATPRAHRRDAAMALAELAYRLDLFWQQLEAQGHELVCTFCVLGTGADAGFTRIAGTATFELDMRSRDRASLDLLHGELERLAADIARTRCVEIMLGPETGSAACDLDPALQESLRQTADALSIPTRSMPSGGGHDAVAFAQAGIPAALLFVRNQNGSHTPREAMRMDDFADATRIMMRWLVDRGCVAATPPNRPPV